MAMEFPYTEVRGWGEDGGDPAASVIYQTRISDPATQAQFLDTVKDFIAGMPGILTVNASEYTIVQTNS